MSGNTHHTLRFNVVNYTRYNTDDLIALVRFVEAAIPAVDRDGTGVPKVHSNVESTLNEGGEGIMVFRDFTGTPKHEYDYSNGKRQTKQRLLLARSRWKTPTHFRILPPEKLHENPLESLVQGVNGQQVIPSGMVIELGNRICGLYKAWGYRYGQPELPKPDFSGLQIRVETKRSATAPKRTRKAVALERLASAHYDASWRYNSAKRSTDGLADAARRMIACADTLGFEHTLSSRVDAMWASLSELHLELERLAAKGSTVTQEG